MNLASLRPTARIILLLLALVAALLLRESVAPAIPEPGVQVIDVPPWLLLPPNTQKSRQKVLNPPTWREVVNRDPTRPTVSVSPQVGLAPLAVTMTLRLASPLASDRELELTVWDAGDEDMAAPLFRSTRDMLWPINSGTGDSLEPIPQTLRASWRLPEGSMLVVGCVRPRAVCAKASVVVS